MRLSVRGIQNEPGKSVRAEFRQDVSRLLDGALEVEGPVYLQATATNIGGRIALEGRLKARVRLTCSRCAQDYGLELDEPIREIFTRQGSHPSRSTRDDDDAVWNGYGPGSGNGSLESTAGMDADDDTDEVPYRGDTLELDELVRETLLLAVPMKPVCRDDCRGLCPVCGGDRNQVQCSCRQDDTDPRLAGLKRWLEAAGGADPLSN